MTVQDGLHVNTPLIDSKRLELSLGKSVHLKLDALQPSGSFKLRGIGRLCQCYAQEGFKQLVASSGGNAGIAVAYCGMKLGLPTTVFIPSSSHPMFIDELKLYGAEVIVAGTVWDEAHAAAQSFIQEHHAAYIPPFDHPMLWAGHATLIDEIVAAGLRPDVVVAAVGGGGLACGLLEGMVAHGWNDIPLIAVETQGADCFAQALKAKQVVTLKDISSRATSLGAKRVSAHLFEWVAEHPIHSVVVTDEEAELAANLFAKDKRILVELSAGAALSVVYNHHPIIDLYQNLLVVVCGGVNTSFFWK